MSVKQEANGRRSLGVEVQVPGTPDEVWQAIATGPGISSWFVPAVFEEQDGKPVAVTLTFGPGMDARSVITAWDPAKKSWTSESDGWMPGAPPTAIEWSVEAREGGVCIIRIVHSLFASTDEWDNQLEGGASAWPAFFRTLQLYLTHFRGQRSTALKLMAPSAGSEGDAWQALTSSLGVQGAHVDQRVTAPDGAPAFSGVLEHITQDPNDALLRIDKPAPGVAALGTFTFPGGPTMVAMNFYFYGDRSPDTAASEGPRWQSWFQERFPVPAPATTE